MNYRTARILVLVYAILMVLAAILAGSLLGPRLAHADGPRAVKLSEATAPPRYLTYLWAGASVTYASEDDGYNCLDSHGRGRSFFTEVSAYRWNGSALGPQHRTTLLDYWRDPSGGRVTFDGITFRNHTHHPVLVAGWCD